MKKILTFLVLLLISGGMLMAQELPMFRYQAVLRDANNELVKNQTVSVAFYLNDENTFLQEITGLTTNNNGLVSLALTPGLWDLEEEINWNGATLIAEFTIGEGSSAPKVTLNTPVTAVPYALQTGDVKLTTGMITNYIDRSEGSDIERIAQAFRYNDDFTNALIDSLEIYIKANYNIARRIAFHYLANELTGQDVADAYDTARLINNDVKEEINDVIMDYLVRHRAHMLDVVKYYIRELTLEEAEELYDEFKSSQAVDALNNIIWEYFEAYLRSVNLICSNSDWNLCSLASIVSNYSVCPTIQSIAGVRYGTELEGEPGPNTNVKRIVVDVFLDNPDPQTITDLSTATVKVNIDQVSEDAEYVSGNHFRLDLEGDHLTTGTTYTVVVTYPGCTDEITKSGSLESINE